MDGITPQITLYLLGAATAGAAALWLIMSKMSRRRLKDSADEWQDNVDTVVRTRDRLINEADALRSNIESQQVTMTHHEHAVARAEVDLESSREQEKQLAKDLFTLRTEREETKRKMTAFQEALVAVKQ